MKTTKRILSIFLALVMLLGMVPLGFIPTVEAAEETSSKEIENDGYIDLPVEFLDFRGDGFLFEANDCWNTPYSFAYRSDTNITLNMTDAEFAENLGTYGGTLADGNSLTKTIKAPFTIDGSGEGARLLNLVQDELQGGKLLYTEEVLIYIAYSLYNKLDFASRLPNFVDKYSIDGTVRNDTIWINDVFYEDAKKGGRPLGSPEDTYRRFAEIPLVWDNVVTTFDMAHYLLYYVWNPVQENDIIDQLNIGDTIVSAAYNMSVPEISNIRLYKTQNSEGKEYYTINSEYVEAIEDGRIICTSTSVAEENAIRQDSMDNPCPTFRPLENLGFEKYFINEDGTNKQAHPINTTGAWNMGYTSSNFLFTMHASGGFVYNEDSDYFFEFCGDDDVYFFINDKLITDIGGIHNKVTVTCELNDYAGEDELNLEDGQICSFDMYFADRHTTGINLTLSTNIELMDYDLLTQKKQFDATNGVEYYNGRAVPFGTAIDYQFSILNRKELPASNVEFVDQNLGVELSEETIKLSSAETYTADADLSGKGLFVTYTPYVKDGSYSGTITTLDTIGELQTAISPFTTGLVLPEDASLPKITQAYRYNVKTAGDLMQILAMGIPGYCEFAVYGVERTLEQSNPNSSPTVIVSDANGVYSNTLTSSVIPAALLEQEGKPVLMWTSPVNGVSTCRIKGFTLGDVSVTKPLQVVLDYGKPVDITGEAMAKGVNHNSTSFRLDLVGLELPADNEKYSKNGYVEQVCPTGLLCTGVNDSADLANGTLTRQSTEAVRFSLNRFLEEVDHFYAVLSITPLDDPEEGTVTETQAIIGYIYLEIQLIPANMVYYEAEAFANSELFYEKKDSAQGLTREWSTKTDEDYTEVVEMQDLNPAGEEIHYADYTNNPDVLFFGFDNTEKDQARYASVGNGYGGYNFDDPAEVKTYWKGHEVVKIRDISIDRTEGALKIIAQPECKGVAGDEDQNYPDAFVDTIYGGVYSRRPLSYNPKNAEVYQVRFKMKNFRIGTDVNGKEVMPYVNLQYQTVASTANGDDTFYTSNRWELSYDHFHTYVLNGDKYVVMTLYNSDAFRNSGTVNKIRAFFGGVESISESQLGEVYIDYIYLGPYDLAPVKETYGWDRSYLRDNLLSDGKSLYIEGNGVRIANRPDPENYTEINFTFTGTGFDLITRTGANQGTLRVMVYKDEDRTKHVKAVTVNNKGELELYQIPTVSVQDLDHGTYYVTIGVNKAITGSSIPELNRGNQLYLDAIRIYDPIDVSQGGASTGKDSQNAYVAYCTDGEAYPIIQEVREILLSADDFNSLDGTSTSGMVYVDYREEPTETVPVTDANGETTGEITTTAPDLGITDHVTGVISTYDKVGPKNEVYLSGGQAIAFKFVVYSEQIPARLDIGCKVIDGNYVRLHARVAAGSGDVRQALFLPIYSGTAQYYSLPLWEARFHEGIDENGVPMRYIYVVIENFKATNNVENTKGILSVTDLKVAYDQEPTLPEGVATPAAYNLPSAKKTGTKDIELPVDSFVDFVVDGVLAEVVDSCIGDQNRDACSHADSYWITVREPSVGQDGIRRLRCPRCGEILETETVAGISDLAFVGTSVSLQSDLSIHYKVRESFFAEGGYADPYVVINDNGVETVIRDYVVKDGILSFVYNNIAPHRIGDTVTATLYAYYGQTLYCSKTKEYSVGDYCYNMLRKYSGDNYATLRTLLVDILLYGAKSQQYMSYRLESLCSSRLTEVQLAWGTELTRELVNHRDRVCETVDDPTVQWKGIGLNLRESVVIRLMLESESYEGLEVRITLEGETYTICEKDFDYREDGTYVHFCSLNAAQMSEPIYVAAYRDGVQVSDTVCYSIESYAYSKQNDTTYPHLAELVKRMMCYGDSCRAYIGK